MDVISSQHEALVFPSCIDARCRYEHADSHWLFDAANANF